MKTGDHCIIVRARNAVNIGMEVVLINLLDVSVTRLIWESAPIDEPVWLVEAVNTKLLVYNETDNTKHLTWGTRVACPESWLMPLKGDSEDVSLRIATKEKEE